MKIPFIKLGGALVLIAIAVELLAHAHAGKAEHDEPAGTQVYDDRFGAPLSPSSAPMR